MTKTPALTIDQIWQALEAVKDPEIPVVSLVEMGIIRDVAFQQDAVVVTMTPTFSGCPALKVMADDITTCLKNLGADDIRIETVFDPPWTSEWIKPAAREKLKGIGLAPPPRHNGDFQIVLLDPVACPYCDSENTSMRNSFGPTPCRMIFYCNNCQQPFEQFKPL
ncbi:MAG: phenylacetate-CoA oxygenase subunit PaaJ [Anaerolineae bacterium]|nr:phenylacetate-CoA oxygenase subunit PaaJ [Anaerolineae bacterium]